MESWIYLASDVGCVHKTLEITTKIGCPISYTCCPQKQLIKSYVNSKRMMTYDDYRTYLSKVPVDVRIDFSGFCEPFAHVECSKMIRLTHERGYRIALYTIKINPLALQLPDEGGNARIKADDEYLKVLETIKAFPNVQFMAMGTIRQDIRHIVPEPSFAFQKLSRASNVFESSRRYGPITCQYDLSHFVLLPDGRVVLCCMDYSMKHVIGDLNNCSYDELTYSPEMKAIKESNRKFNDDYSICRRCEVASTIFNKLPHPVSSGIDLAIDRYVSSVGLY